MVSFILRARVRGRGREILRAVFESLGYFAFCALLCRRYAPRARAPPVWPRAMADAISTSVKVAVRVRGLTAPEAADGCRDALHVAEASVSVGAGVSERTFT
jgi:hypothetical protein